MADKLVGARTKRVYGTWAGNPAGHPEKPDCCIKEVWPTGGGWIPHQCTRKRGFGPDGLYCKQHGKKAEAREASRVASGRGEK